MNLTFTKMQGAGNDFVVLDGVTRRLALTPLQLVADVDAAPVAEQGALIERHVRFPERVRVHTRGGDLTIRWEGADNPVWLTGPAVTVFEGEIEIDES